VTLEEQIAQLKQENAELRLAVKLLRSELEERKGWPMPEPQIERTPPDAWGQ
jgi:cell division protein FtsB